MALGASLLEDVAATAQISPTATDATPTGSISDWGSALGINIDSLTPTRSGSYSDHSGGQDIDEWNRLTKRAGSAELAFKWGPHAGINVKTLVQGKRIKIIAVTTVDGTAFSTVTIQGIITEDSHEYAGPSTGKISIKACGGTPLITTV